MAYEFDIHVLARNEDVVQSFQENNPHLLAAKFHVNPTSMFAIIRSIVASNADYALICHDDVTYPSSFIVSVEGLIAKLNTEWPNWGIGGNSGISVVQNVCEVRAVKYLIEDGQSPSAIGHILPAETIDGNTILINCRALRDANVSVPEYNGIHEYDTILSVAAQYAGLSVLICPELSCYHQNIKYPSESVPISHSRAIISYLSSKITNQHLVTLRGRFSLPKSNHPEQRYDLRKLAAVNASKGRSAKVGVITRSQFRSFPLLKRTIESVKNFRSASIDNIEITHYIVTDVADLPSFPGNSDVKILHYPDVKREDSRNVLIQKSIRDIGDDFILLLDDDDWLFSNEAFLLTAILATTPRTGSLVIESQQFEEVFDKSTGEPVSREEAPIHVFRSEDWQQNFSGINHIPACGAFYSRELAAEVPEASFKSVTYFEDFSLSSFLMINARAVFFNIPVLTTGISVRSHPDEIVKNTITEKDRSKWNRSLAELAHAYSAPHDNNVVRGIGNELAQTIRHNRRAAHEAYLASKNSYLSRSDRMALVFGRTARGVVLFSVKPHLYAKNIRRFMYETNKLGLRGFVRAIADTQ